MVAKAETYAIVRGPYTGNMVTVINSRRNKHEFLMYGGGHGFNVLELDDKSLQRAMDQSKLFNLTADELKALSNYLHPHFDLVTTVEDEMFEVLERQFLDIKQNKSNTITSIF